MLALAADAITAQDAAANAAGADLPGSAPILSIMP
jgi:hypothetical protein